MQTIAFLRRIFVFDRRSLMKARSFCNYRPMLRFFKSAPFRRFRFREEKVHFRAKLPPTVLRFTARFYGQKSDLTAKIAATTLSSGKARCRGSSQSNPPKKVLYIFFIERNLLK